VEVPPEKKEENKEETDEEHTDMEGEVNQSINQRSSQSHTRAEEKPHPSTTTGGANPASQSDAGLGGYERVATALVCETRSFSTPFIFQWRA